MLEELKKLEALQVIDSQIFNLEEELDALPDKNESLENEITEKENKISELKNAIELQATEKEKRDEILKKGEEKLKTITGKQSAIRNKEEYNALLREIDNTKRFNRDLIDEINEINFDSETFSRETSWDPLIKMQVPSVFSILESLIHILDLLPETTIALPPERDAAAIS